jgi:hypothetical protein
MSDRHVGVIELPFALIAKALQLPDGIKVTAADVSFEHDEVRLKVEGDALPDNCKFREGGVITRVRPQYRETFLLGGPGIIQFERFS